MSSLPNPQDNVPVGNTSPDESTDVSRWHGMTIKDILENVGLFNFTLADDDDEKLKDSKEYPMMIDSKELKPKTESSESKAAFLGPQLWKSPERAQFSAMNFDEFLAENNFDVSRASSPLSGNDEEIRGQRVDTPNTKVDASRSRQNIQSSSVASHDSMISTQQQIASTIARKLSQSPTNNFAMKVNTVEISPQSPPSNKSKNKLPKGENDFLYVESKRARIEREKEERRRKDEAIIKFSAKEMALATIPGAAFDPSHRQFSLEELRPQPIIRKRKRTCVKSDKKDEQYWDNRKKNNVAARRSREARRLKENQISLRTAFLEQQNASMKATLKTVNVQNENLRLENKVLIEKLRKYASIAAVRDVNI